MTNIILLEQLKEFMEDSVHDLILPVAMQKEDKEPPEPRAAEVYSMRLPDGKSYKKKAPYIINQVITNRNGISPDGRPCTVTEVRSVFCVYNGDEQAGGLALLELMDRIRIALLKQVVIGKQFRLDTEDSPEYLIYTDDTAPYYGGEMMTTWYMPVVKREVTV